MKYEMGVGYEKRAQRLNFLSGSKVLGTSESGGSSLYLVTKNGVQTAISNQHLGLAENPLMKRKVISPGGSYLPWKFQRLH